MRIGVLGKGGSGKTTLTALLAMQAQRLGLRVLAIDADINQNLALTLGWKETGTPRAADLRCDTAHPYARPRRALAEEYTNLKKLCVGTNSRLDARTILKTTPPGPGSGMFTVEGYTKLLPECFAISEQVLSVSPNAALRLIETGGFEEAELGTHCYHSKTGAVELFLNHLVDEPEDLILVDMTAGVDCFASGLFAKFDLVIFVVEPSYQAVRVLQQFQAYSAPFEIPFRVCANKVTTSGDVDFVRDAAGSHYLCALELSSAIANAARTGDLSAVTLPANDQQALALIISETRAIKRDYQRIATQMELFHRRNALDWGNQMYGCDLTSQIAEGFSPQLLRELCEQARTADK